MGNLARYCETLVEDMTPIKRTLTSPSPGPSHQSIPAILVCRSRPRAVSVMLMGILELQGWTDGMDPDLDPDLSLFIAVMTLVIGVMTLFIGIMTLIRGLVLRLMASLIVHAPQIVYITGMWSELK